MKNRKRRLIALLFIATLALLGIAALSSQAWWPPLKAFLEEYGSQFEGLEALVAIALALLGWFVWLARHWLNSNPPPPPVISPPPAPTVQITESDAGRDVNVATDNARVGGIHVSDNATVNTLIETQTIIQNLASEERLTTLHSIDPPPATFIGREAELDELQASMRGPGVHISGVAGMGGVGKTALARSLAQRLQGDYPDAQILLNMRGTREQPRTPADAMTTVIRAFHPDAALPESEGALRRTYLSVLHGRRALLLLDDARDKEQVETLMPPPTCALIVTSRQHFVLPDLGLHPLRLNTLPPADAITLLRRTARRAIGDAEAARLVELCGYLPLALRLAGSALAERPTLTPTEYARLLQDEQRRLDLVEASLTLSYNLLDATLQQRWRMLAVFPATYDRLAVASVWGMVSEKEQDDAAETLTTLVRYSLVEWLEAEGRYRLHDLARLFAITRLADDERDAVQRRHAAHFLTVLRTAQQLYLKGGQNVTQGLALFDAEWPNIQAGQIWSASHAQHDNAAARLCSGYPSTGIDVLLLRLHSREQIEWLNAALAAARRLNNRGLEGSALGNLGLAYARLGEVRQAITYHQKNLAIARETGDRRGEGSALGNLGLAYADLGEVRQAIDYHQQYLTIARELGDRRGEANALGNLGNAYADLGEVRQAIDYYERALVIDREIGDRRGEGTDLWNMSLALDKLGERRPAIPLAEAALHIFEQIEDPDVEKVRRQLAEWRGEEPPT